MNRGDHMFPVKVVGTLIGGLFFLFILRVLYLVTPLWVKIQTSPWWVYALMGGILLSGYLSYKYSKEERDLEQNWIEQEGEAFMEPIRKRRQNKEMI
jgi:hypothetical protein